VLVGCLVLGGGLAIRYLFVTSPDQQAVKDAPRITDAAYEAKATAICKSYEHLFNTETTLGQTPTQEQAGAFLDHIAGSFDAMVDTLAQIPVTPAAQGPVAQWLSEWRQYDSFGHTYAAAVAQGAERNLVTEDSAGEGKLRRTRNGFAKANHMSACAFN